MLRCQNWKKKSAKKYHLFGEFKVEQLAHQYFRICGHNVAHSTSKLNNVFYWSDPPTLTLHSINIYTLYMLPIQLAFWAVKHSSALFFFFFFLYLPVDCNTNSHLHNIKKMIYIYYGFARIINIQRNKKAYTRMAFRKMFNSHIRNLRVRI